MNERCSQCGGPLPSGALAGLCPACLLRQGAAADTAAEPDARVFELPSLAEVARLFPQLELIGLLGRGGMGAVYKARQPALDRLVALKLLPSQVRAEDGFAQRFTREARALARLSHPNIVALHEFGQVQGWHYFIMEFVDGANLRQLQRAGLLTPREALQVVPQICDALQYAHEEGVVHRDIKPENVLVDRKWRVKIADFGLAKILGRPAQDLHLTREGTVMGTPHYMAPEQIEHPLDVDHRADIFSLGVVFYEMLTGELPLGKFAPPSKKVEIDVRVDEVVLHALEKEPQRRYQHASEVKTDVLTITEPSRTPAIPAPAAPPRRRWLAVEIAGLAIALILGTAEAGSLLFNRAPKTTSPEPVRAPLSGTSPGAPASTVTSNAAPRGLVARWHADGNGVDSVRGNNAFSLKGVEFDKGVFGQAFKFSGDSSSVNVLRSPAFDVGDQLTVEFWMKAAPDNMMQSYQGLVASEYFGISIINGYSAGLGVGLFISTDGGKAVSPVSWPNTADANGGGAPVSPGRWHHIAGTYDGEKLQLYVDGRPNGRPKYHTGPISPMGREDFLSIGSEEGRTAEPGISHKRYFKGLIDEVAIYDRALSAEEIAAIHRTGVKALDPQAAEETAVSPSRYGP